VTALEDLAGNLGGGNSGTQSSSSSTGIGGNFCGLYAFCRMGEDFASIGSSDWLCDLSARPRLGGRFTPEPMD